MSKHSLKQFFVDKFVNYGSYDNIRKIASVVDGNKNAARKALHTVIEKNISTEVKVSQLNSKAAEFTEYLHGSMENVIVNMAQSFGGSNNLPLLVPEGNFGTRFIPEASASRYIYTYKQPYLDFIFKKEDRDILVKQHFEGTDIEPLFMVPTIPMLLINGSEGVSSGFAQKILPRDTKNIIAYLKAKINGDKLDNKLLTPHYNNTSCVVEQGDNPSQWLIKGTLEKVSVARVLITEIPSSYSLKDYISELDDLEEKGVIKSYTDMSQDSFKFEVQMDSNTIKNSTEDELLSKLKLIKKITENYTVMSENNRIIPYDNVVDVFNHFYDVKLQYMTKRKEYQLSKMKQDLLVNTSRAFFIMSVIKGDIEVNNKKKDEIIAQVEQFDKIVKIDDSYNYLLNMPIYNLTKEKFDELKDKIKSIKEEISNLENTEPKRLWLKDIEELEKALDKKEK